MLRYLKYVMVIGLWAFALWSCKPRQKAAPSQTHTEKQTTHKGGTAGEQALHDKLGLSHNDIEHDALYRFVNDWYGVPYQYGGCKKEGVDCSCFAGILYNEVYQTTLGRTTGEMYKSCDQIAANEARKGDLFFFKINGDKISHVGICLNKQLFVHASTSKGVMINSIEEAYYKKYFYCAGRIKKS